MTASLTFQTITALLKGTQRVQTKRNACDHSSQIQTGAHHTSHVPHIHVQGGPKTGTLCFVRLNFVKY